MAPKPYDFMCFGEDYFARTARQRYLVTWERPFQTMFVNIGVYATTDALKTQPDRWGTNLPTFLARLLKPSSFRPRNR